MSLRGAAEGTGLMNLERSLRGEPSHFLYYLKGGCSEVGVSLLSQVTGDRMRQNGLRLCQRRFSLDIRRNVFMEMVTRLWKRLSKEVIESLCHPWRHLKDICFETWFTGELHSARFAIGLNL